MGMVAVGHWLGIVFVYDASHTLRAGNALDFIPSLWWFTWIGQVMPLFFFVGGFASATALRSAERKGTSAPDWVARRLRRMMAPAVLLAATWAVLLLVGAAFGGAGLVTKGAVAAAIPLWFLANYVLDTAVAPYTFRAFRRHRVAFPAAMVTVFGLVEIANLAHVRYIPEINWVIGWMLFQVLGFAWQGGLLPTGRRLLAWTGAAWAAAVAAVAWGPWPATMLHQGGLEHSPTHPPSFAFVMFGVAYSLTAAAAAPAITRWLTRSARAWRRVVAANSVAMSVYLWHMTAATIVLGASDLASMTPTVDPGSGRWWLLKLPFIAASVAVLVPIVRRVAPVEQRELLAPARPWTGTATSMTLTAVALSVGVKMWSSPNPAVLIAGLAMVLITWLAMFDRQRLAFAR